MKVLTPAERLIVAADFKPKTGKPRGETAERLHELLKSLHGTGVCIKVNSILRSIGYGLIEMIRSKGLKVFADLKLFDISETLAIDGAYLAELRPDFLTVACFAGIPAMQALKAALPDTEILGVSVLTSFTDNECRTMFSMETEEAVLRFARFAEVAGIGGLISSAREAELLRANFGIFMTINTPAIRPRWALISGDDQNPERVMTPARAIYAGADRIVVGRPITQAPNPYDAVMRTLEEIASVTS